MVLEMTGRSNTNSKQEKMWCSKIGKQVSFYPLSKLTKQVLACSLFFRVEYCIISLAILEIYIQ